MIEILFLFLLQSPPADVAAETCMDCHEGATKLHKQSEHFKHGVRCSDCHGGSPTVFEEKKAHEPNFKPSPLMDCVQCHEAVGDFFKKGPHGEATNDKKMRGCVDCHSYHKVLEPTPKLLVDTCVKCHSFKPALIEKSKNLETSFLTLDEKVDHLKTKFGQSEKFQQIHNTVELLAIQQHAFDWPALAQKEKEILAASTKLELEDSRREQERSERKRWLIPIWAIVLINIALIALRLKRTKRI